MVSDSAPISYWKNELAIDTTSLGIDEAVQQILLKLEHEGYLR